MTRIEHIYTPIQDVVQELFRRRALSAPTVNNDLESLLAPSGYAVLFRQVATPNFELERFLFLASITGLIPLVFEFHQDKFVTRNPAKYALARMGFFDGIGRNGGPRSKRISIVDLDMADGTPFTHLTTSWGESFVEFHHGLLSLFSPNTSVCRFDGSEWLKNHGGNARNYYTDFFQLFVRHAVLFESFLLSTDEDTIFTTDVVLPAFAEVVSNSGFKPLICKLDPPDREGDPLLYSYPMSLHQHVAARLQRCKMG